MLVNAENPRDTTAAQSVALAVRGRAGGTDRAACRRLEVGLRLLAGERVFDRPAARTLRESVANEDARRYVLFAPDVSKTIHEYACGGPIRRTRSSRWTKFGTSGSG